MEETNKRSLINIISFYTEAPAVIELKIRVEKTADDRTDVKNKLQKRYENLVE